MRWLAWTLWMVFFPLVCQAGGTLEFKEIEPLLKQSPNLSGFLYQSFELPEAVFAETRLGPRFKHLSAARIGPYIFRARPKGSDTPVLITLCTRHQFLDAKGKILPEDADEMFQASRIRERLTAVLVQEVGAEAKGPACPE